MEFPSHASVSAGARVCHKFKALQLRAQGANSFISWTLCLDPLQAPKMPYALIARNHGLCRPRPRPVEF